MKKRWVVEAHSDKHVQTIHSLDKPYGKDEAIEAAKIYLEEAIEGGYDGVEGPMPDYEIIHEDLSDGRVRVGVENERGDVDLETVYVEIKEIELQ